MKDNNLKYIIGGIGAFFLYKKFIKGKDAERLIIGDRSNTPLSPSGASTPTATQTKPSSNFANRWIFSNVSGGETLYEAVNTTKDAFGRYGKNPIMKIPAYVELGVATGAISRGLIQIRVTINQHPYSFWVAMDRVRIMDGAQRERYVFGDKIARRKTTMELNTIEEYFRHKK